MASPCWLGSHSALRLAVHTESPPRPYVPSGLDLGFPLHGLNPERERPMPISDVPGCPPEPRKACA